MRYFGSKSSTIDDVYRLVSEQIPAGVICDPFGGIGSVGAFFSSKGYSVFSGDQLTFPHYFQIARLKYDSSLFFSRVIAELGLGNIAALVDYLNSLQLKSGWFTEEYSSKRMFFTPHNARKIQACRRKILEWDKNGWLSYDERAVLTASLINSMDKVANTAGTYYAFLKAWHRKALIVFKFQLVVPVRNNASCQCFLEPAGSLINRKHYDILYLDPPYNQRSYAHYYHLPETIALGRTPKVHGQSGIPSNIDIISEFNKPSLAKKALENLLVNADFKLLVFHYADNGLISPDEIREILSAYGSPEEHFLEAKGYTTQSSSLKTQHHLYLVRNAEASA